MKFRTIFFHVIICLIFTSLIACSSTSSSEDSHTTIANESSDKKDSLVLAIGSEPEEGFDPTTGWGRYGSPLFQSTLLKLDRYFNVQHDLATAYEVSEDGLEWTVKIRQDALFSDGESLTADDVIFTFETAKNAASVIDLQNLIKLEKISDYEVKFILEKPQSTFIYMLTTLGIVPKHAYSDNYNEYPIGSGPFQLVQWDKGQQLIVEQNPYYYAEKPQFKRLIFLFLEEDAAFLAAKAGEVDIVAVPANLAKEEVPGMKLLTFESVDNRGIMFPYVEPYVDSETGLQIGNAVTSDVAIRKAINIAIDREKLVTDVLEGFGTPAYSIADQLPWWNEETVIEDGDLEKAEKILHEAGWTKNDKNIFEKDGMEASFTLVYPASDQTRQSLAIVISQMLKEFGIDVKPEGKSWSEIPEIMHSTPILFGWGSHDPIEMYYIYHSKHKGIDYFNANYYENKQVDYYIDQAINALTEEEANENWKKAQWDGETGFSTLGDAPWAWLVNLEHTYFVNEKLNIGKQKIQPHGHGRPITEYIADWKWED